MKIGFVWTQPASGFSGASATKVANLPSRGRLLQVLLALVLTLASAQAHLGSPDIFYDGLVGPYPARITIRLPGVVPGRAQITIRVQTPEPVSVSFLPLYAGTAVSNAPPADPAQLVPGETNLYSGELWLMSFGAYSIDVRIRGTAGEGAVQLPVNSVATRQLPLPSFLGKLLLLLGVILFLGGIGIIAGAARQSGLAPGIAAGSAERRRGLVAAAVTCVIFVAALAGGKKWWSFEETDFRRHLREGAWPDLSAEVLQEGPQNILRLTLGKKAFPPSYSIPLVPDHGKLLHLFVVREPRLDGFAHLHPMRKGGKTFEAVLPPLAPGTYKLFCDLTFEESGLSSTATNTINLRTALAENGREAASIAPDPDDSWAIYPAAAVPLTTNTDPVCRLADGLQVLWHSAGALRANQDAGLNFELRNADGKPVPLEPYMGMLCHAAVLRSDVAVFAHLHPSGNYSMAAQMMFTEKIQREASGGLETPGPPSVEPEGPSMAGHMDHNRPPESGVSSVSLPYQFPAPGKYHLWLQFKTGGRVVTAVFAAVVL